jgi:NADH dehydrogenase
MNVLVTGGTGFVGQEVLCELQAARHGPHLLARHPQLPQTDEVALRFDATLHRGDVLDRDSLGGAAEGMDAVIHLVGIISEVGEQTFENVHVRGTQNVISAAQRAGVKRFVHMSALGTRPDAAARYHQSKWAAEEIVRRSGLDWTIFRPSIIYGRGDGFVNLFAKIIRRSPVVPIIGHGRTKFQPIAVENVARAFGKSLSEPKAIGQTFDLCGPETFTLNEIVETILAATKRRRMKLHLPIGLAKVQAAFLEFLFGRLLHRAPPLNRDQVLMLQEDNVGNGRVAEELFGLKRIEFKAAIVNYISVKRET